MRKQFYTAIALLIKQAKNTLTNIDYSILKESILEMLKD